MPRLWNVDAFFDLAFLDRGIQGTTIEKLASSCVPHDNYARLIQVVFVIWFA